MGNIVQCTLACAALHYTLYTHAHMLSGLYETSSVRKVRLQHTDVTVAAAAAAAAAAVVVGSLAGTAYDWFKNALMRCSS